MAVLQLGLAAVFLVSSVAKWRDLPGFRSSVEAFGVPASATRFVSVSVPMIEGVVAAGLLLQPTAGPAAIIAVGLLAVFSTGLVRLLLRGERPVCKCFGELSKRAIGWPDVARNAALGAGLMVVVLGDPVSTPTSIRSTVEAHPAASLILLAQAVIGVGGFIGLQRLYEGQRQLMRQIDHLQVTAPIGQAEESAIAPALDSGLPVGALAPEFDLVDGEGVRSSLRAMVGMGKPTLVVFVSPTCGPCIELIPELRTWEKVHATKLTFAVITSGNEPHPTDAKALIAGGNGPASTYRAEWTPAAVLVDADGRVAQPAAYGLEAISDLVFAAISDDLPPLPNSDRPVPGLGPAGSIDLDTASDSLLVFWNSTCPFCADIAPTLNSLPSDNDPQIVYVTSAEDHNLTSSGRRSIVDRDRALNDHFDVVGTPSAVLLDKDGRQRSAVAAGAENVMSLLGVSRSSTPVMLEDPPFPHRRPTSDQFPTNERKS